ncbi:FAD-dependent oxidoreductase [Teichococcus aestuarii]|uniref:FAD-dependent oxidoreductase n=1 Tax=Teichococcus aestuarii TaxID=568898 RepID=UPI00362191F6
MRGHAAIIGAGIVGAATALALRREGWDVTLIDPGEPGGEQAASYGNGACSRRNPSSRPPCRGHGRRCRASCAIRWGRWPSAGATCRAWRPGCCATSGPAGPRPRCCAPRGR